MDAALVIGGGAGVWQDLDALPRAGAAFTNFVVNDIGVWFPGEVHHWVTLHHDKLPHWRGLRAVERPWGGAENIIGHSIHPGDGVQRIWPGIVDEGGLSGLMAVRIALLLGAERVVLAGVPVDGSGNFFRPAVCGHGQHDLPFTRAAWSRDADALFAGRVRSLSGWTRELLGAP